MRITLLASPGLPPAWGVSGGIWKPSPFFDHPGRLPLDGELEAAFYDVRGFDSRMRVSGDGHARLYRRFHEQRRIARRRAVRLRQDLSCDTGRRRGWRALRR